VLRIFGSAAIYSCHSTVVHMNTGERSGGAIFSENVRPGVEYPRNSNVLVGYLPPRGHAIDFLVVLHEKRPLRR